MYLVLATKVWQLPCRSLILPSDQKDPLVTHSGVKPNAKEVPRNDSANAGLGFSTDSGLTVMGTVTRPLSAQSTRKVPEERCEVGPNE